MAGARNTNRRLQRILLRGVVFPAAAAGAIILGASAASAEDGPLSGSLQETTSAVQSTTDGAIDGAPEPTEAQPAAAEVDTVTTPEPEPAAVPAEVPELASDPAPAPTTPEPLPVVEAPAEDATAAATEAASDPVTVVEKSAPASLTQPAPPAETTTRQETVPDLGGTTRQVTDTATEPIATMQSEVTDSVGAVTDRTVATVDDATAPVERVGDLGDTAAQTGSVVREVSGTATQPVESVVDTATQPVEDVVVTATRTLDATTESTPIFDDLRREIVEPVAATTSDVTDGALASVTETTPIFDDLRQEILGPVVETAAIVDGVTAPALAPVTAALLPVDGVTTPVLAPLTGTLSTIDGITTPVLAPLTGTLPTIDSITTPVRAPLTTVDGITTPVLATLTTDDGPTSSVLGPLTGTLPTINSLTTPIRVTLTTGDGRTSSVLAPLTGTLSTVDDITTPILTAEAALATTAVPSESLVADLTAPVASVCVSDEVSSSATSSCAESGVRGDAAGSLLHAEQSLLTAELMIAANGLLEMVDSLTEGLWFASEDAASSTSTSGATEPADPFSIPRPLFPEGVPVLGGTSILGSGSHGQSGPILLLLLAVVGASVLLRNGGLSQLAIGTSTMLSGRAAVVQDRPG